MGTAATLYELVGSDTREHDQVLHERVESGSATIKECRVIVVLEKPELPRWGLRDGPACHKRRINHQNLLKWTADGAACRTWPSGFQQTKLARADVIPQNR